MLVTLASPAAAAAATGAISGRVTDAVTHDPLANVCVDVYDVAIVKVGSASTAADGTYTVSNLESGDYGVAFRDCAGRGYISQYWDHTPLAGDVDLVRVSAGSTTSGIDAALHPNGGTISGRVTDVVTHDPVNGECVTVLNASDVWVTKTTTGPGGTYTIPGIEPGSYHVRFDGCADSTYLPQYYNGKPSLELADLVPVSAGGTASGIDAALQPGGKITGTVRDASTDQTLGGVCVYAYAADDPNAAAYAPTDSAGRYQLSGLATGNYKVSFQGCSAGAYATQFYDKKPFMSSADSVSVTAGDTTAGIDAALHRGGRITGTVTDAGTHAPIGNVCVGAFDADGHMSTWTMTDGGGNYTLTALEAGDYKVGFASCYGSDDYVSQYYPGTASLASAGSVPVRDAETTPNINAALELAGKISGTVSDAVTHKAIAGACVGLFDSANQYLTYVITDDNGDYTISDLAAGTYKVGFASHGTVVPGLGECPTGPDGYATQVYNDKLEIADGDGIAVTAGATTSGIDAHLHSSTIRTLTVSVAGTGSGKVAAQGLDCPGTCSHGYPNGEATTLHATAAAGSTFAGWSGGGCSGTGACTVTMSSDQSVTATFALVPPPVGKPTVAIAVPADAAGYVQDQVVAASYSCAASAGTTLTSCAAPVAPGQALDTHALGPHTFTVTATDTLGSSTSRSVGYTVIAKPTGDTVPAPVLAKVRQTANKWRAAVGTTFSFTLNVPAKVSFVFTQKVSGRKVGKNCVAQTRSNARQPKCTRTITAGVLTVDAHSGANAVRFAGRISRSVRMSPGSYTVTITATNAAGKRSPPAALTFTIVK